MSEEKLGIGHVLAKKHDASTCGTCVLQAAEKAIRRVVPEMMQDVEDPDIVHGEFDTMSVASVVDCVSSELVELATARARLAEIEAALKPFADAYERSLDHYYSAAPNAFTKDSHFRTAARVLNTRGEE